MGQQHGPLQAVGRATAVTSDGTGNPACCVCSQKGGSQFLLQKNDACDSDLADDMLVLYPKLHQQQSNVSPGCYGMELGEHLVLLSSQGQKEGLRVSLTSVQPDKIVFEVDGIPEEIL